MKFIQALLAIVLSSVVNAQGCSEQAALEYQLQLNAEYADPKESPLTKKDLAVFTALEFYPVDMTYCIEAKFVRTPNEKPFIMPTTGNYTPRYVKFGQVTFVLQGEECRLDIFQNLDMVKFEKYKNDLFLPFTDITSGNGSYGGGRYIDLKQPDGDTVIIDFNTAYNPYCAYNHNYSCPIPPPQNDLKVEVKAGVKDYNY